VRTASLCRRLGARRSCGDAERREGLAAGACKATGGAQPRGGAHVAMARGAIASTQLTLCSLRHRREAQFPTATPRADAAPSQTPPARRPDRSTRPVPASAPRPGLPCLRSPRSRAFEGPRSRPAPRPTHGNGQRRMAGTYANGRKLTAAGGAAVRSRMWRCGWGLKSWTI
jgi:hypothetical protein